MPFFNWLQFVDVVGEHAVVLRGVKLFNGHHFPHGLLFHFEAAFCFESWKLILPYND